LEQRSSRRGWRLVQKKSVYQLALLVILREAFYDPTESNSAVATIINAGFESANLLEGWKTIGK